MSRVLVIDDSPMLVELTVRALGAAGYQASGATDLASLDQKLTEGPFSLILMDVNMPEMFGDDVVEYLRTQKKVTSKLVLYSDISEEELAAKTRNSGADAYILKGGGLEAVIGGIMRILGAPTGSAVASARPATAPAAPVARPPTTSAAPRPPAVAPATRPTSPAAAPRPVAPGTHPPSVAPAPRMGPSSPVTQSQAIPGPRAAVPGQVPQARPVAQAPMAGAHPAPAAPRAPVPGQVPQARPVAQAPMAGAPQAPAVPRAPVPGQVTPPRPVAQAPVAAKAPIAPPATRPAAPTAPVHAAAPTAQAPAKPMAPAAPPTAPTASAAPPAAHGPAPVMSQAPAPAQATPPAPTASAPAPAAPAPTPAPSGGFPSAAKLAAVTGGKKPRILIVDDSEMTARIIEADLVSKGFEVHIADSADKATKIILKKQTRPDLVLLDVRMPNVNGEQFCRFIKSNSLFKGIKVLLCSGENVEELQRICREAGADGYVPKDAVLGNLVAKEFNPAVPGNE